MGLHPFDFRVSRYPNLEIFEYLMFLFMSIGNVELEVIVCCHLKSRCLTQRGLERNMIIAT